MARKRKSIDFEAMIDGGENSKGFTAQTPNGTAHWMGTGWNGFWGWEQDQVKPDPVRPAGRSNRTGE